MSYLLENDEHITGDVYRRKEFYQYSLPDHKRLDAFEENIMPRFMITKMINDGEFLQLHSYQLFISNYMNPNTPYTRILIKWQTGIGKTIGSLAIALKFIDYYRKNEDMGLSSIGSVYIIGFSHTVFRNELLRFPELGIITHAELNTLKKLRAKSYNGSIHDIEQLKEFLSKLKKKFGNRTGYGFFKFIGYKQLVGLIFNIHDKDIIISDLTDTEIDDAITNKKITLNINILQQFKNSLLICDEIHNVYNTQNKNNWGAVLQYVLNYDVSIRAVFMSATPINNSPTEIVDLLNLLLPKKYYKTLNKSDLFDSDKKLLPDSIDKISKYCKGRISYLRDSDPKYYPSKKFIGECIPDAPYLKFVRCPMSKFHYNTYKAVYKDTLDSDSQYLSDFAIPNPNSNIGMYQTSEITKLLPYASQEWKTANMIDFKDNRIVGDILKLKNLCKISTKYTMMMETINEIIKTQGGKIFIYHNIIQMSGLMFIQEVFLQNNIIGDGDNSNDNTLCSVCGCPRHKHNISQLGGNLEPNIVGNPINIDNVRYNNTTKFYEISDIEYKIMDDIIIMKNLEPTENTNKLLTSLSSHKIIIRSKINKQLEIILKSLNFSMIYHNYYANYPLKYDRNMLQKIDKQLDYVGGNTKDHTYMPVRFITIHSDLDKNYIDQVMDKYSSPNNSNGHNIMILIGGRMIKEAYDIKAVREILVMSRPDNIPTLIQILGRAIRKNSHKYLPPERRNVNIRLFTSCLPEQYKISNRTIYKLAHEEIKYIKKLAQYKIIQSIEKTLHENAIDAHINKDIIWSESEHKLYKTGKLSNDLGPLYFTPTTQYMPKKYIFKPNELNLQTFNTYYMNTEIDNICIIIKLLFIEKSPIWTYQDLLYMCRNANQHLSIEFNAELIDEDMFIVALTRLVWAADTSNIEPFINTTKTNMQQAEIVSIVNKIYDTDDKVIILPGNIKYVISQVGIYYIMFPLDESIYTPIKTAELPYRLLKNLNAQEVDILEILKSGTLIQYTDKRDRFYNKWNNISIDKLELAVCDFGVDFHIMFIEECIEYIFRVWTDLIHKKSTMHTFYFKMVNYYDLHKIIVWGHTVKSGIFKKYTQYLNPVNIKLIQKKSTNVSEKLASLDIKNNDSSGIINMLKSSINKSGINWISTGLKSQFNDNLELSLKLFDGNYRKPNKTTKVNADLVPVGHFMRQTPRFYHPVDKWFDSPEYLDATEVLTENDIVVGYDERSSNGIHIRFKIRKPIQDIKQYKDTRMIEKGSVCSYKSKEYLRDLAKKLGIKYDNKKLNVSILCNDIRTKILYYELKERSAGTKIKWFYFIYEKRPETINN